MSVEICVRHEVIAPCMNDQCPPRDTMSFEEATISNMLEIAAIVEAPKTGDLRCTFYC